LCCIGRTSLSGRRRHGASDEVLHKIMNDNPRRFLAFMPKVKRKA